MAGPAPTTSPGEHDVAMEPLPTPTVQPHWLLLHHRESELRILDVRWSLTGGADEASYHVGHIPGATFVDLDRTLAGPAGPKGRHPLPDPEEFGRTMRAAGISATSRVVVYDQVTGAAARAWWLLRASGLEQVAVLEGGLEAYSAAGGALSQRVPDLPPGDLNPSSFTGHVSADLIPGLQEQGYMVLDARTHDRYRGVPNPLDPRPGHLPGAKSLPWTEVFPQGYRLHPDTVRERLHRLGHSGEPIIAYCGSGVTACALLMALEGAGVKNLHLYPGSWSEWAADPSRPVELES